MARAEFKVISPRGATVAEGVTSITYLQNETFFADTLNPSVVKLLQEQQITLIYPIPAPPLAPPVGIIQPTPGMGPPGPTGPTGPTGPAGPPGPTLTTAHHLATTGADVVIDTAAPPTTGQTLTATSATTANWQTPSGGSETLQQAYTAGGVGGGAITLTSSGGPIVINQNGIGNFGLHVIKGSNGNAGISCTSDFNTSAIEVRANGNIGWSWYANGEGDHFWTDGQSPPDVCLSRAGGAYPNGYLQLNSGASAGPGASGTLVLARATGLNAPVAVSDATPKSYVDDFTINANTGSPSPNYSLVSADRRKIQTNTGAGVDIFITLPAITLVGERYLFAVTAAHYLRVNNFSNATTINLGTTTGAAGGFVRSNVPGAMLELIAVSSTQWFARVTGDWTVDA